MSESIAASTSVIGFTTNRMHETGLVLKKAFSYIHRLPFSDLFVLSLPISLSLFPTTQLGKYGDRRNVPLSKRHTPIFVASTAPLFGTGINLTEEVPQVRRIPYGFVCGGIPSEVTQRDRPPPQSSVGGAFIPGLALLTHMFPNHHSLAPLSLSYLVLIRGAVERPH